MGSSGTSLGEKAVVGSCLYTPVAAHGPVTCTQAQKRSASALTV
jgi:hypothetical protein